MKFFQLINDQYFLHIETSNLAIYLTGFNVMGKLVVTGLTTFLVHAFGKIMPQQKEI